MNCIKQDIIQKYIDREASLKEIAMIEKHLTTCSKCAEKIDHQKKLAGSLKKAMDLLVTEAMEIPSFVAVPNQTKRHFITRNRIIYSLSAACILLFILICTHKKEQETQNDITLIHSIQPEVDANKPITKQPMIINVIDSKGNLTEYLIR